MSWPLTDMAHQQRKRFGQHFLRDSAVIENIVAAISPQSTDTIVEIGPGEGVLTAPLARTAGKLHIVELDRDLVTILQKKFATQESVTVHSGDALQFDFSSLGSDLRVTGNLPYNISTPLLFHLIEHRRAIRDMHFMLQKEVVNRMAAEPGSKAYGRLTIMLGCFMNVQPLFDVPAEAFDPPPKVVSAVVRLWPRGDDAPHIADTRRLSQLVAEAFSQRRKTLRNALKNSISESALIDAGVDPGCRPEQVAIPDWVKLANTLVAKNT